MRLPESSAVTVKVKAVPTVADRGVLIEKWVTGPLTAIELEVPATEAAVSFAVMVLLPAVAKVAEKVPVPLVSVEFAGSVADVSVLVKLTVPE